MTATALAAATTMKTYQIDPAHSEVTFQVRHLLTKVRGGFSAFTGTIELDEADPNQSSVQVAIDAASIDTNQPDRDTHLRSADFFSVAEFPEITFISSRVVARGREGYDVTGLLTIHGVTHEVVLPVKALGKAKDPWGHERQGFEAELTISRKDYGLHWNAALETGGLLVGDEVTISLSIQAILKG